MYMHAKKKMFDEIEIAITRGNIFVTPNNPSDNF